MDLINALFLKMIDFYSGDSKRIQHFTKVHSFSKLIAECERIDEETQFVLESVALTHDIGIRPAEKEFGKCDGKIQEKIGPAHAEKMLTELGYNRDVIERVCYLIAHHHTYKDIVGEDYQILVEADFLVNLHEDNISKENIEKTIKNIFKTKTGTNLCKTMFISDLGE
ncbi:MAG: HD domain-containing protein [Clostridia bacterium]